MAVVSKLNSQIFGNIVIWRIEESYSELYSQIKLRNSDFQILSSYKNEKRKVEFLLARIILEKVIGEDKEIIYDEFRKPYLKNSGKHISISHSRNYLAFGINRNYPIGIDIEEPSERIMKVSKKFLSEMEISQIKTRNQENELRELTKAWCSKEAIIKVSGNNRIDFRNEIVLIDFNENDNFNAKTSYKNHDCNYMISIHKFEDSILALAAER